VASGGIGKRIWEDNTSPKTCPCRVTIRVISIIATVLVHAVY